MAVNNFEAVCYVCSNVVPPGKGIFEAWRKGGTVRHSDCQPVKVERVIGQAERKRLERLKRPY